MGNLFSLPQALQGCACRFVYVCIRDINSRRSFSSSRGALNLSRSPSRNPPPSPPKKNETRGREIIISLTSVHGIITEWRPGLMIRRPLHQEEDSAIVVMINYLHEGSWGLERKKEIEMLGDICRALRVIRRIVVRGFLTHDISCGRLGVKSGEGKAKRWLSCASLCYSWLYYVYSSPRCVSLESRVTWRLGSRFTFSILCSSRHHRPSLFFM